MMNTKKTLPRGIRNNNPLNIRIGNVWLGEVSNPIDPAFEQFVTMPYGCRAAFVLFRRYIRHYHRTRLALFIEAWAPRSENDTTRYIDRVSKLSGIALDEELRFEDEHQMCSLMAAMAIVENGQPIKESDITAGYSMC